MKRWSRHHDRCQRCRTTDRPHNAKGFCRRCYNIVWHHRHAAARNASNKAWRLANPDKDRLRQKIYRLDNPVRIRALNARTEHSMKALFGCGHRSKWRPSTFVAFVRGGVRYEGNIVSIGARPTGTAWVIDVLLDGGRILTGIPTHTVVERFHMSIPEARHWLTEYRSRKEAA